MNQPAKPESRFRFDGGNLAIDLVNTVDWAGDTLSDERLEDYAGLLRWGGEAGVLEREVGGNLTRHALQEPDTADQVYAETRELRTLLQQLFLAYIEDQDPPPERLLIFNRLVQQGLKHRSLRNVNRGDNSGCLSWQWDDMGEDLRSPWWPVVDAAATLLTSKDAARLKVCASPTCGWMFIDNSRNGMRRWCAMDGSCGARAKARRHYARVKQQRED